MQTAVALTENDLVLGRYRPLRPLGSGGGGSVWLARDEHAGRDVALKVVAREGKPGARAEREVDAATRLRHPRCLRALALARDDRHVYVAYPYVAGRTLREALRARRARRLERGRGGAQVLEALAHAHTQGVVHRDVKPANVMLEDGDEVSVRLLDFGLAQLEHADTLTAVGDVPGTLAYIAPERLAGAEATGAADVWAVGVLLWEALAGRHPFWAVSPLETARAGRARARSRSPSCARTSRASSAAAVDRMLSVDPRKRPTAKQALSLLRAVEQGRTRAPARETLARTSSRERAPHAALAALFAGVSRFPAPLLPVRLAVPARRRCGARRAPEPGRRARRRPGGAGAPARQHLARPGLAYVPLALAWLVLFARDARSGLLFLSGPLLAFVHLLPLVPVIALEARGPVRRAALAVAAVVTAVATVAVVGLRLPLTAEPPPQRPRRERDGATGRRSRRRARRPDEPSDDRGGIVVLVAVAAASAGLHGRGLWGVAAWGAGFLGAACSSCPLAPAAHARGGRSGQPRRSGSRRRVLAFPLLRATQRRLEWALARGHNGARHMSVLRSIEHRIESIVEGVFGRAFRTHVQPVELARKLAKEMDDAKSVSVSRVYVPNEYTLYLCPGDREQFSSYEDSLLTELSDYLSEHARREGYALLSTPTVLIEEDEDLGVGEFGIATRMVQPDRPQATAPPDVVPAGRAERDENLPPARRRGGVPGGGRRSGPPRARRGRRRRRAASSTTASSSSAARATATSAWTTRTSRAGTRRSGARTARTGSSTSARRTASP